MRRTLGRLWRGLADHPGPPWLLVFALMGYKAGGWLGVGAMLLIFGTPVLVTAWQMGKEARDA